MPTPAERSLIASAQEGDVRAFETLIGAYIPQVRRFARAFAADDAEADDLAQDALVKAYKSVRGYRFQAAFSTWLYTVVRSVFLDHRKSRAHRQRASQEPYESSVHGRCALGIAGSDDPGRPDAQLEAQETRAELWAAINSIPEDFRTVLVMADIEGLSHDEIAAVEGIAQGTVKSRLSRARDRLRQALSHRATPAEGNRPGLAVVSPQKAES